MIESSRTRTSHSKKYYVVELTPCSICISHQPYTSFVGNKDVSFHQWKRRLVVRKQGRLIKLHLMPFKVVCIVWVRRRWGFCKIISSTQPCVGVVGKNWKGFRELKGAVHLVSTKLIKTYQILLMGSQRDYLDICKQCRNDQTLVLVSVSF